MENRRWNMEEVTDLLLGSKITADGWWLQPWNQKTIASWQESYDISRQYVKKHRHYSANQGMYSQGYVFPVVTYGCESWNIKKAENQRIDVFELW